jgi:hypothetical protein
MNVATARKRSSEGGEESRNKPRNTDPVRTSAQKPVVIGSTESCQGPPCPGTREDRIPDVTASAGKKTGRKPQITIPAPKIQRSGETEPVGLCLSKIPPPVSRKRPIPSSLKPPARKMEAREAKAINPRRP